jgi:hypothetical protein
MYTCTSPTAGAREHAAYAAWSNPPIHTVSRHPPPPVSHRITA